MYRSNGVMLCTIDEIDYDGIDPFVIELLMITGNYFSYKQYIEADSVENKEKYLKEIIKEELKALKKSAINYSWSENPDRMGC
jgi:hypothetical protein